MASITDGVTYNSVLHAETELVLRVRSLDLDFDDGSARNDC